MPTPTPTSTPTPTRADVIKAARRWLGTPYRHQASRCGAGADCLGLIRGVYRELYGYEPETPPPYTPDWAEAPASDGTLSEAMADAARRHLCECDLAQAAPGDVVLFRMVARGPAKHAAILVADSRMIHAYSGRAVCETTLGPWWRARLAFSFRFPGVTDIWPH